MIQVYDEHPVDTPFIAKNYKDALKFLEKQKQIEVEAHRIGTFGDNVVVHFPPKEGSE
jgi:hypothetical protein